MPDKELNNRQRTEVRMTVLLGIIQQLMTTRHNRLFSGSQLTLAQFGVLNHFTHEPERRWTVTELAEVMEMNQPGITKIVTVLLGKGLLESESDAVDKRKRYLSITKSGLAVCADIFQMLLPEVSYVFAEWRDESLGQFHQQLEKLMLWLDQHRDDYSTQKR